MADGAAGVVPLLGMSRAALAEWLAPMGEPAFRAKQLARWIYEAGVLDFGAMTDLPAALRVELARRAVVCPASVDRVHASSDGTLKLVLALADGERIEAVAIPEADRWTLCVSSQVGCPVACAFCATGLAGVRRSLTVAEILAQFAIARARIAPALLTNVVFMGMGEPLLNAACVLEAISVLNDPDDGFGFGARRITVSTVGIASKIALLADDGRQFGLALSLHAPDDELRRRLVPYPQRATIAELLEAAARYYERTRRVVTIEYVLLAGVNDEPAHGTALGRLVRGGAFKVNAIPWNPVAGIPGYARPGPARVDRFVRAVEREGVGVTVRRQRGDDVAAACGQLAGLTPGPP